MARASHQVQPVCHQCSIGAGPGGYAAAFYAADLGMQVTLIDDEKNPGGVCLYRGCIPSKALLHVAKVLDESKHATDWGIEFGAPKIDVDKLRAYKNHVVEKLTSGTGQVAKLRKINYLQGWASIVDAEDASVKKAGGGEETVNVDYMILATGSQPTKIPALSIDCPRVLDSTGALDLPEIPKTMLVDRRRLHRPRARLGLRRARHQGVGRRDDARAAARRRSRPGQDPGAARREDVRQGDALDQGHRDEGRQGRRSP